MFKAARPVGTDGSDHEFREVVVKGYQALPYYRAWGWILIVLVNIVAILKVGWFSSLLLLGANIPLAPLFMLTLTLASMGCFILGKPGKAKENIITVKLSAGAMMMAAGLCGTFFYAYHLRAEKDLLIPSLMSDYLEVHKGIAAATSKPILTDIEAYMDCGQFTLTVLAIFFLVRYCQIKEDLADSRKPKVTKAE